MDGTQFVAAKSHGTPFDGLNESVVAGGNQGQSGTENDRRGTGLLQFLPEGSQLSNLINLVHFSERTFSVRQAVAFDRRKVNRA